MTADIHVTASGVKAADTELETCCLEKAPASIEGFSDGALSVSHLVELLKQKEGEGCEGYVIACFDDTGLDVVRELVTGPVIGIGEAAMHVASMVSSRYSLITSLERSVPIIEDNGEKYGLLKSCRGVHAFNLPVLAFEKGSDEFDYETVLTRARQIVEQDRSDAVVLGCGGMSHLQQQLSVDLKMPVIDGVRSGVKLAEALMGMGMKTSKAGAYAAPLAK